MPTKDDQDRMCEAAINHAAEALKEIARSIASRRSGVHARRDLESAIVHLRQATKDATEAFTIAADAEAAPGQLANIHDD